jgi:CHAD domain-containing protein
MDPIALTCSFGADILRKHLQDLRKEIDGVRNSDDIEAIHHMRVASRRLRAALPLFADCFHKKHVKKWTREIKKITTALGSARDTDVQLDLLKKVAVEAGPGRYQPGLRRLILRITQDRKALQAPILTALDRLDRDDFYAGMETELLLHLPDLYLDMPFPHNLFERSADFIQKRLAIFLSYEPFVSHPELSAELHAMRIAAKGLRYTLENFAPLYPGELDAFLQPVKTTQELLGDIHDCDVWLLFIPKFIEEERERTLSYYGHANPFLPMLPGLSFFKKNRQQAREQKYTEFSHNWDSWKEMDLWNQLRHAIAAPVYSDVFPLAPQRPVSSD